jgi:hypothetical protein
MDTYKLVTSTGTSRGRDTYGYTIVRLDDTSTGKRYRTNGGGYDMVGTVFGEWLQDRFQDRLMAIADRVHVQYDFSTSPRIRTENTAPDALYGMARLINLKGEGKKHFGADRIALDGACGINSMIRIAEAIGLEVRDMPTGGRSRSSKGFVVTDTRAHGGAV